MGLVQKDKDDNMEGGSGGGSGGYIGKCHRRGKWMQLITSESEEGDGGGSGRGGGYDHNLNRNNEPNCHDND